MGRPAAPSQIKRHTEQRRRGRGSPQHPFSVFSLRGRPVRSMRARPEKGPLESRSPAILRTQEKPPEYCRGLFLLRALSIKKDTESTVQAVQPATRRTTFFLWLCHSIWLLHLYNTVKIQTFSQDFPLAESIAKAFCRLSLWNFKEKSINHFLGHSLSYTTEFLHRFGLRLEDGAFSPYKRTPAARPPHQSKFLR